MPFLSSTGYSKIWYAFFSLLEFEIEIQNSEDNKFKSTNSPGPSVSPKA